MNLWQIRTLQNTCLRSISWTVLLTVFLLAQLVAQNAYAVAIVIASNTNWSAINSGSGGGGRPNASDTITVGANATLTVNVNNAASGNIVLGNAAGAGTLRINNGASASRLTVSGTITMGNAGSAGNLTMTANSNLVLRGFNYVSGTFTPGTGNVTMTADNTLPNTATLASFHNFIQSAGAITTLSRNTTINGVLTLTGGRIDTGNNILIVPGACSTSVSRPASGGFVNGFLRLSFVSGSSTCLYQLGSATGYAPISVAVVASGSGTLSAASLGADHPQIASSAIDATKSANRYWSLWQSGDTLPVTTYGVTLNYNSGDLDITANTANFALGRYNGATWTSPSGFTTGSNLISLTGQSGPLNSNLSFATGEAKALCNPPADITGVTLSCVCDNFSRTSLNPSAIYGSDWALSSSGGSFGVPKIINSGSLRLTDNTTTVATAATVPANFPASGNMIVVEFKSFAYNGSGADGMALTLSDANILPQPGAYGGSLGYAQKVGSDCTNPSGCAGFAGGWIGVALDEYGNFSQATEGRVGGPGARADSVAVRGSGSGASSAATNYPYLDGTGSLTPGIDNAASTTRAFGHAYRVVVDARTYTPTTKTATVSVFRDTSGAGTFNTGNRLLNFDAYQRNPAQAAVPSNWKLSFTGSTGGLTNIHEISGLKICAQTVNPPTSFRIAVDNLSPANCGTIPSGRPKITVTALDINGNVVTSYNKTVTLKAVLANGNVSSGVWSLQDGDGTLVGNQYTFVAADQGVATFVLTDTVQEDVFVGVQENGTAFGVTFPSPLQYRGGSFSISNIDSLASDTAGGVVAGRAHLFSITRSSACGVDTSYSGAKSLDGWISPEAGVHPAGAQAARFCAPVTGTCAPSTGTCSQVPNSPPALVSGSNNLPSLTFTNGVANFCLVTSDVGRYSLNLRDDLNTSAPVAGASNLVTVRPFAVVLSNVRQGIVTNPATDANTNPNPPHNVVAPFDAPLFGIAGNNFSVTAAGYLWNSAADVGNDGLPDSSALFSVVSANGLTPSYADTINFIAQPAPTTFVPVGGTLGTVSGSVVISSGGTATSNTVSYPEVGSFSLSANVATDYLASSVNLGNRVIVYANPSLDTRSAWVGRFKPNNFALSGAANLINRSEIGAGLGCTPASTFTYMSENMNLSFGLSAINSVGAITRNYVGGYAKLDSSNWFDIGATNSLGLAALAQGHTVSVGNTCNVTFDTPTVSNTSFRNCTGTAPSDILRAAGRRFAMIGTPPTVTWLNGQSTFSAELQLHRADSPDGPYTSWQLGIAPRDSENVTLLSSVFNMDGDQNSSNERLLLRTSQVRYGRMLIDNAYGSERLPLPVKVQAQYWQNGRYVIASDDACTPLLASNFSLILHSGGITPAQVSATNIPLNSGNMAAGQGTIRLIKPTNLPANPTKGSVSLRSSLTYLPGTGRLTFGVYKAGPVIYIREIY